MTGPSMRQILEAFDTDSVQPRYRTDVDPEMYSDENMEILRKQSVEAENNLKIYRTLQDAGVENPRKVMKALVDGGYKIVSKSCISLDHEEHKKAG